MKVAMISQPMANLTPEQIRSARDLAIAELDALGYEVLNTYYEEDFAKEDDFKHKPVAFLGRSIIDMSKVDLVYFCDGWAMTRGCSMEHRVARDYGIPIKYQGGRYSG